MNRIYRRLAGTVLLTFGSLVLAQDYEHLPVQGVMLVQKDNTIQILSSNGRFEFGTVYDRWSQTTIDTLEAAHRTFHYLTFDGVNFSIDQLHPYRLGQGTKTIALFVDPHCPYCHDLLSQLPQHSREHQFQIIPVALLGQDSVVSITQLHCASDQQAAFQALRLGASPAQLEQTPNCRLDTLSQRMLAAKMIGITQVPFLIRDDGLVSRGIPKLGLSAWLDR